MKIFILLFVSILILLLTVWPVSTHIVKRAVNWNSNWARGCDFKGRDLSNARIRSEDCGGRCAQTSGCTHFTWTNYQGGTCWMKQGSVSKSDAFSTNDQGMVCGISDVTSSGGGLGPALSQVHATRHAALESGACALPTSNYAVVNPVALGTIESLKHLKFLPELCGQIVNINCGYDSLDVIITNSNIGGGLDLYASTWSKLTRNKPPGETSCTIQLTNRNAFNFGGARCFYKPGTDFGNSYYHNVGLLNTQGRRVVRATIDNRAGEHRGDNPYFAFDFGPIDGNKQIVFTFNDGTTQNIYLRDCQYEKNEQMWS